MSKYVRVSDTDYKLTVNSGGTITFDTGNRSGSVVITGNLTVLGDTTTISSENMAIKDNIIVVNDGENSSGVSLGRAGLQIDRGSALAAQMLFDESIYWRNPVTNVNQQGAFVLQTADNRLVGLQTSAIVTNGTNLNLLGTGTSVVSVSGTTDYELHISDPDDIPNVQWVDDFVKSYFTQQIGDKIVSGDSELSVNDTAAGGSLSLTLDGAVAVTFDNVKCELQDLRFSGSTIQTMARLSNDITLSTPSAGSVIIDRTLQIQLSTTNPSVPTGGIKLFAKAKQAGDSGIFVTNVDATTTELASRRRALAFSMIF